MKTIPELRESLLLLANDAAEVDTLLYDDESNTKWQEYMYTDDDMLNALLIMVHIGNLRLFSKSYYTKQSPEVSYKLAKDFGLDIFNVFKKHGLAHLFPNQPV